MTLAPDVAYEMTDLARGQLEGCGIARSELFRLLQQPAIRLPGTNPGEERLNGYGLSVLVKGNEILTVAIDGATAENWSDWARERAEFGDGDVAGADALVRETVGRVKPDQDLPRQRKKKVAPPVTQGHILDRVHPALRDEVTRQVDGDFSRLVVHSPVKVTIQPPR